MNFSAPVVLADLAVHPKTEPTEYIAIAETGSAIVVRGGKVVAGWGKALSLAAAFEFAGAQGIQSEIVWSTAKRSFVVFG
jgi:hypothetical protein